MVGKTETKTNEYKGVRRKEWEEEWKKIKRI